MSKYEHVKLPYERMWGVESGREDGGGWRVAVFFGRHMWLWLSDQAANR